MYPIFPNYGYYPQNYSIISGCINKSKLKLINHIRMLWEQHITWTRIVIMSIVHNLPDTQLNIERLLRNPIDFQKTLVPFYGNRIALRFKDLLADHLTIAAELVNAAKSGNKQAAADAEKRWYANANEIAAFLGSINPYWSQQDWKNMLNEHLSMTKSEAVDMLTQNYNASIEIYDEIERQALKMADVMANGIIRQFPVMV